MGLFRKSPVERYGASLLDRLPLGISIYRLADPADLASFVVAYTNAASGALTGLDVEAELGRRLVDVVPGIAESGYLDVYHDVLRSGEARDLGTVTYGDERIRSGTFSVQAVPLADDALAVVFEDVSGRSEVQELRATRAELDREEARYRSLVEATAAIVWTTPPSGELQTDQERWHQVTGQTPDEAAGWGWLDAVHPDDREATAAAWAAAVRDQTLYAVEHRLQQAGGGHRRMSVRAAPIRDEQGAIVEWVGVHTDIEAQTTAAAALAASEARFRTLFDALDDVVLVYPVGPDGGGAFLTFNAAAIDRYGYTPDELRAMTPADLVDTSRVDMEGALEELRRTRRATFDSVHLTKDGRRLPMATSARLVEYDGRLCVVSLCRDDTDRRQFRRAIARANHELERAVDERTRQLEAFSEDLKILHGITTAEHASSEARYEAYLHAGCEMFDLSTGIFASTPLDPETGERLYRLEAVVSPDPELAVGLTVPIQEAFCDAVLAQGGTVTYADAREEAPEHPACVTRGLRAYIGTPVVVGSETVGTLNFVAPEPRPEGFSDVERDLIEVMAQAIGRRIEADRAESAEAEARERYRTIVETVDAGVIVVDRDLRIVMSNPSARELLGLDMGHGHDETDDLPDRWPVLDVDGVRVPAEALPEREVFRTGRPVRGVIQGIVPPGQSARWYRVNAAPADVDGDGRPEAAVVSFHDVTDFRDTARRAERSQDLLRAVLAASEEGIIAYRAIRGDGGRVEDFEILLATPRAALLLGRDPDDLVGRRLLEEFPHLRGSEVIQAYARVVTAGEVYDDVVPSGINAGATVHVRAVPLAAEDGLTVTFSVYTDVEAIVIDDDA